MPPRTSKAVALNERPPARANRGSIFQELQDGERLYDAECPGLFLQAGRRGRTYHCVVQVGAVQVRRSLGKAQTATGIAGALSVEEARKAATQLIEAVAAGIKPEVATARRKAADAQGRTFLAVANAYLADGLAGGGAALKSKTELERKLKVDLADWHNKPVGSISRSDVKTLLRNKAQASPAAANRLRSFLGRIFAWAVDLEMIEHSPVAGVPKPAKEKPRDRLLSREEIKVIWRAAERLGGPYGRLVQLAFVLGARRGELAGLRRSELGAVSLRRPTVAGEKPAEARAWLLPPERTKTAKAHTVALPSLALKLIDEAPVLVHDDEDETPFDHVLAALADQPIAGWSKYRRALNGKIAEVLAEDAGAEKVDPAKHCLPEWHLHDARAAVASHMELEPLNIPRPVISRVLGHAEGEGRSMTSRYLRHRFDEEAADALQRWSDELEHKILADTVTALRKGA